MKVKAWLYRLKKRLYLSERPNWLATVLNRCSAAIHALGIAPNYLVALQVSGRRSGRTTSLPFLMARIAGERYLVSMHSADSTIRRGQRSPFGVLAIFDGSPKCDAPGLVANDIFPRLFCLPNGKGMPIRIGVVIIRGNLAKPSDLSLSERLSESGPAQLLSAYAELPPPAVNAAENAPVLQVRDPPDEVPCHYKEIRAPG